jgi:hypothetical protein
MGISKQNARRRLYTFGEKRFASMEPMGELAGQTRAVPVREGRKGRTGSGHKSHGA